MHMKYNIVYITYRYRAKLGTNLYTQSGPPSENRGPWADVAVNREPLMLAQALLYRALLYRAISYLLLTMLTVGPARPIKVAGPLGICPPATPLGGPVYTVSCGNRKSGIYSCLDCRVPFHSWNKLPGHLSSIPYLFVSAEGIKSFICF